MDKSGEYLPHKAAEERISLKLVRVYLADCNYKFLGHIKKSGTDPIIIIDKEPMLFALVSILQGVGRVLDLDLKNGANWPEPMGQITRFMRVSLTHALATEDMGSYTEQVYTGNLVLAVTVWDANGYVSWKLPVEFKSQQALHLIL